MNKCGKYQILTADLLRQLVDYDATTGVFRWRVTKNNRLRPGDQAGSVRPNGYVNLGVAGKLYLAHRLAWLYVHGKWPDSELDHVNRIRSDNRIANLREATRALNCQNSLQSGRNTSGHKGVYFCLRRVKWCARIYRNGRSRHLGYFALIEDAVSARLAAETLAS